MKVNIELLRQHLQVGDLSRDDILTLFEYIAFLEGQLRHYDPTAADLDRAEKEGEAIESEQDAIWNDDETE